jgi:DNA polymerase III delta subunit
MRSSSAATILKEITAKPECPACIVITSPDRIRRERALEYLVTRFAKAAKIKPRSFSFGEQGRNSPVAFLRDLEEPSLFEPTRFAIIRSIESAKAADVEPISEFLRKEVPGVHLFIVGESLPNTPNFKKALDALAVQLPFDTLKGAELHRWVEREVAQSGIEGADDEVIELLVSLGCDDPETISRLIEKFSLYLGDSKASRNALKALEPGRATASDFELAETLLGKNRAQSETLLLKLINQGSSPFMLLGLLTKTFSSLYRIRVLLDRGISHNVIKTDLGMSPWLFSKYLPLAQRSSAEALAKNLQALLVADFRLKDRSLGPAGILSGLAATTTPGGR